MTFLALIVFSLAFDLPRADAAYSCGSLSRCEDVTLKYGGAEYAASGTVYFTKGEQVSYSWDNDSPGIMQVEFYISKDGKQVSSSLLAPRYGNNFSTFLIPSNGYYYLFAACDGGNDDRCQGGGMIRKF